MATNYEVVVVGAGLTGLTTALLLARGGRRVAVVEAREVGACATGNTTGKVALLQGTRLSTIAKRHSTKTLRKYVEANREGQQWLLRYCAENGVATQVAVEHTYAQTPDGIPTVRAEMDAAVTAGLDAEWVENPDVPFPALAAVRLAEQAQLDPLPVLESMTADIRRHGGEVFENARVTGARERSAGVHLTIGDRIVTADNVVLATGTPILDRGGFFARLEPQRSYAAAFDVPGDFPRDMFLSADQPSRSLRFAPSDRGDLLLVGGNGHPVGRERNAHDLVVDLIDWTRTYFPGAQPTHTWSAQDYSAIDELPYVGPLLPGDNRILVASGFSKWGMTNGVAAALALSARIFGGGMPWADVFETWRTSEVVGLPKAARMNSLVAAYLTGGWVTSALHSAGELPAEGEGTVVRKGVKPVARSTVDGVTTEVSAICPHLYGIVAWNSAEKSWDCPLHGSRFAANGTVLEGPTTAGLGPSHERAAHVDH
ncbi:FAD-dependent oxidoreductase [Antrihabitans sp. NCIMB 15449]|jgi:glycine/D-amino acid oxidase-like deaminating enzyme/nitrite reductase/ring-hydroxylating ferredoxin subunit|uniref:FAD-dependent oxidoreductase n=1 Tax=Antrihabitans spumae TaxID=3373370 RepID=A0ABW7JHF2_9NOCA